MANTQATHTHERSGWLQRVKHWLSHPTSEVLPPIFGDAVPPDMKLLQAEVDEARQQILEAPAPPTVHGGRSKLARRRKSSVSSS